MVPVCDCVVLWVPGSNVHSSSSSASMADEKNRGVAVEKLENMKKWGLNTYKVAFRRPGTERDRRNLVRCLTFVSL